MIRNLKLNAQKLAIILLFALSSCVSERDLLGNVSTTEMMNRNVNGTFNNSNILGQQSENLADLLYGFERIRFYETSNDSLDSLTTRIEYDGNKRLHITFLDTDSSIAEFDVKVKNKQNYLSIKPRTFLIPIPFLFFILRHRKAILFTDKDGYLHFVKGEEQMVWVFMAGGNTSIRENKFKPVK